MALGESDQNTIELLKACSIGDPKAQQRLYDLFASRLFAIARRYIPEHNTAEDILIESFVKIFSKLNDIKNPEALFAWMKRIVINNALMHLRSQKISFAELVESNDTAEMPVEPSEASELLTILEQLPVGCKTVFNLYVFEEMTHPEIAQMLNISVSTSKSQYQLARQKLLKLFSMDPKFSSLLIDL